MRMRSKGEWASRAARAFSTAMRPLSARVILAPARSRKWRRRDWLSGPSSATSMKAVRGGEEAARARGEREESVLAGAGVAAVEASAGWRGIQKVKVEPWLG